MVFPVVETAGNDVIFKNLGRDKKSILEKGDWVEIVDDDYVLQVSGITADQNSVHPLLQVMGIQAADVDQMYIRVTLSDTPKIPVSPTSEKHALLRRWDQKETNKENTGKSIELIEGAIKIVEHTDHDDDVNYWLPLEDGVYVQFQQEGCNYRSGDYWLIPARVITGDVEWPESDGEYLPLPPRGVKHHYAPLAIIAYIKANVTTLDLRYKFNTLVTPAGQ